ncbi:unnamed protein product [Rotaria sp. Silwood2]|nr:unnamed protein product [Rotaria sp. Silwood2]
MNIGEEEDNDNDEDDNGKSNFSTFISDLTIISDRTSEQSILCMVQYFGHEEDLCGGLRKCWLPFDRHPPDHIQSSYVPEILNRFKHNTTDKSSDNDLYSKLADLSPSADLLIVLPVASSISSYQDIKSASAWIDSPTVSMITSKSNPVKLPIPFTDSFSSTNSPFLSIVNEVSKTTFHFNPTITKQTKALIFQITIAYNFVHYSVLPSYKLSTSITSTPLPSFVSLVKSSLSNEHQIIQNIFDLLAS